MQFSFMGDQCCCRFRAKWTIVVAVFVHGGTIVVAVFVRTKTATTMVPPLLLQFSCIPGLTKTATTLVPPLLLQFSCARKLQQQWSPMHENCNNNGPTIVVAVFVHPGFDENCNNIGPTIVVAVFVRTKTATTMVPGGRHALPCPALPCPALPCPALPCPALPCPALPCPALPCPALPCPALPCPALPCPALPCPALPWILGWGNHSSCSFRTSGWGRVLSEEFVLSPKVHVTKWRVVFLKNDNYG